MINRCARLLPRAASGLVLIAAVLVACPALAADAVLYRIFMRDGSTLVSYGEYTHVAGQVVFSIAMSGVDTDPSLQLVSLPESLVDWERTDRYAEAARARQYAATRGETDFAALSNEVARTLSDVAQTEDPARRLAIAERARRTLAEWPSRNYGYRAADVAQLSTFLDEVISELRVAAGLSRFDLSFVATTAPPPPVALLPAPTLRESIEQAFTIARTSPDTAQRVTLLRAITDALAEPAAAGGWAAALRARAAADLVVDTRIDQTYADFSERTLASAEEKKRRGDVKAIEGLVKQVLKMDDRYHRVRPQATAALLATLDLRLDEARRLRLARDRWSLRLEVVRAWERRAQGPMDQLLRVKPALELIRQLAGPSPRALPQFYKKTATAAREFALIKPAVDVEVVHGIVTSAFQMALAAVDARIRAARANDMSIAWEASSAAAGALLLFDRAREELRRLTEPPTQ